MTDDVIDMETEEQEEEVRTGVFFRAHDEVWAAWNALLAAWGESDASGFSRLTERAMTLPTEAIRAEYDALPRKGAGQGKFMRAGVETKAQLSEIQKRIHGRAGRTIEAIIMAVYRQVCQ